MSSRTSSVDAVATRRFIGNRSGLQVNRPKVEPGLALNAVRCSENAKSIRKCVRSGLACVRLHGSVRFVFMFVFGVRVHVRGPILRKSTNSTLGKRASFSQNSQK